MSYFMSLSAYVECHLISSSLTVGFYLSSFPDNKPCVATVQQFHAVDVLRSMMASAVRYEAVVSILFSTVGKIVSVVPCRLGGAS